MKIDFKILALAPLLIGSLMQGYALVRAKEDQVPEIPLVSAYVWQVDSPEEATAKQQEITASRFSYYPAAIEKLLAKIGRGSKHAYHYDIVADNKGRNAEQDLNKTVYVFITKLDGAILGGPFKVLPHGVFAFTLVKNSESLRGIEAKPTPQYSNEFVPAKDDKRNIKQLEKDAQAKADKLLKGPLAARIASGLGIRTDKQTSTAQYPPAGPVKAPRYVRPVKVPRPAPVQVAPVPAPAPVAPAPVQAPAPAVPAPQGT